MTSVPLGQRVVAHASPSGHAELLVALQSGEAFLVRGVAGGVGIACVQLAKRAGARAIGTARGDDRLERLMEPGIDYTRERTDERARENTAPSEVDLVVAMAGGPSLLQLLASLRQRGRFSVGGAASGHQPNRLHVHEPPPQGTPVAEAYLGLELYTERVHALVAGVLDGAREGG